MVLYDEHPGGEGALCKGVQSRGALVDGAVVTFRSFQGSAQGWPYLYTSSRSSIVVDSLPSTVQLIDPLDRFRMLRETTCLGDVGPSHKRSVKVYRLRCRADLFKVTLAWRCSSCGEPRVPEGYHLLVRPPGCGCVEARADFAVDAVLSLSDGTGEANIDMSGEACWRRLFGITHAEYGRGKKVVRER